MMHGARHRLTIGAGLAGLLLAAGSARAQASVATADLPPARTIVDRHIEAIGGRAAVMKHRSRYIWASLTVVGERIRGTVHVYAARPNKRVLRVDQSDAGVTVTGFDGEVGWRKDPGKAAVPIRGRELAQLRDDSAFDLDLRDERDIHRMETVRLVQWERRPRYEVRVVSVSGREWTEYFDVESGLFAGSEARRVTDKGEVTLKTVVSAYKLYDGVRLPAQISLRSGGVEQVIKVIEVRHDKVNASIFEPPASVRANGGSPR